MQRPACQRTSRPSPINYHYPNAPWSVKYRFPFLADFRSRVAQPLPESRGDVKQD